MIRLPKWVLTHTRPSVYDSESSTAIEMTAKLYGAMNELVDEYNNFVDNLNRRIDEYEENVTGDVETFKVSLRQEFQDFIDTIALKMQNAENFMKNHLQESADKYLDEITQQLRNDSATFQTERANFQKEFEKQTKIIESQNATLTNGIKYMETAINGQNTKVDEAVAYMQTNLNTFVTAKVDEMIANGEIVVGVSYNEDTESMVLNARNVTMPTDLYLTYNEETETIEIKEQ